MSEYSNLLKRLSSIGERIRDCRKEEKLSQTELSLKIGIGEGNRGNFTDWENGKSLPDLRTMLTMCEVFNCDLEWLLCNPEYTCKRKSTTDIQAKTGLSEKAIERLVETHKGTDVGRISMESLVLNILLEDVGFVFLADSIKHYYLSLDEVKVIEKNPNFKIMSHNEYTADLERIKRFNKFLENPKIPETSDFLRVPEKYRKAYQAALVEAVEENPTEIKTEDTVLMSIIRTGLHTAWLKEKEEKQPMWLYNIQKDFMKIIEEYGKQIDFFKESKEDSNHGTNNT